MAKHRRSSADDLSTGQEVADPTTYWSVDDCHWPTVSPELPVEMVDLLAPPIVVGVARVPVTSRATPPAARPDGPGGSAPARGGALVPNQTGRHRRVKEPAERG
ncbi:hypothetical protein [Micromonospora purpureochromogenes]|uniref:Uncharacterized protein n=1 Tax=Micromonospora purpureochromogenes TaxID=47872 RepID=A0ABX2RHS3_9ACTN|nr:hypothetical protein [Micromonospora purpureochromogenes]NYF54746.1 hypothetical protein [Micromonospora purpureochromogenes]